MGWNEPENGKEPKSGKRQPPDLDEALKRLQAKLNQAFKWGKNTPKNPSTQSGNIGFILGIGALIILILWVLSGIFIVDPAEQAAILRFGKYVETVGPGPHWIPRIIESKVVVNMDRVSDYSYSAQMLTSDENLVSVSVAVQYRIGDLEAYLFNVADPEESLRQATSSALRQVVGNTTLDEIITAGREAWGLSVQDSLVKILDVYKTGIIIVNVSPQPARAPENVQEAFDDAIKAQEDEKRFKEQAYAYQAKVIPIAQGNAKRIISEAEAHAKQVVLKAKGEVAEFLAILPQYSLAPLVTSQRMYFDTLQEVFSKSSKVIVDTNGNKVMLLPLNNKISASSIPANKIAQAISGQQTSTISQLNQLTANRQTVRVDDREERDY